MNLREYFDNLDISPDLYEILLPLFSVKKYSEGELIQDVNKNTGKICLVLEGIVRGYFITEDGNDVTKCFSDEGCWCCFYNYLSDDLPEFYVEALEPCLLAQIEKSRFSTALEQYPQLRYIYDKLYTDAFLKTDKRGMQFQKMSAKQRYLNFINNDPRTAKRVRQEYIASYLGITPSSLCRIKKEL
ncbi:MAG: Crp/Fnr family transcriptional regulator [Oscillospiraceae bacterium]|nr:Crp/Fnr family transcriptional regulator [Oscillospiraceae bacterium]